MDKHTLKRILSYIKPLRWHVLGAVLCSIISVTLTLLAPILVGNSIDLMLGTGLVRFAEIGKIIIKLIIIIIAIALFQWLLSHITNIISYKTACSIRTQIFQKLNSVPLSYVDSRPHGDIMSRVINDVDSIGDGLLQGITQLFNGVVTIIGTLCFMLSINVEITAAVVVITPLSIFVATFIAKTSYKMFVEQAKTQGELSGYVEETVSNQKIVKSFSYEPRNIRHFEKINSRLYNCGVKAQFYSSLANPCTRFVNSLVYASVGVIGSLGAIYNGLLTVGQISCFLTYANQYTKPFNEITGVVTQIQNAFAAAQRVFDVMDTDSEINPEGDKKGLSVVGKIDFENVSFSYKPSVKLIQNLNLHVSPGEKVAIVGPTGCGKTTFINLLMRFYDINSGKIYIDDVNIADMSRETLRKNFGMVLQETWLYSGTIKENICYGKPHASDEEIIAAAKAAHAHNFIKRLPNGYDTVLSENGINLSQGQRQLISIARIMILDPPILILDEATSSIDTRTESQIQHAFAKLMRGKTSFVVAHRLSTIQNADVILVMNQGNIIEQGNHRELIEKNGFYAKLYTSQFSTDL